MAETATISRLESANAQAVMQQVAESGVIAAGQAVVISVAAIRERSGERWMRRREDVYAYVARKLHEHLSHADLFHRLNDTDFLVAMADQSPPMVQGVAMRILEEVLMFFLGAADPLDLKIQVVTAFKDGGLACARLDPKTISRNAQVTPPRAPAVPGPSPAEIARKTPVSFITASGLDLRIDFAIEPMVSLKHQATAARRIEPRVTHVATDTVVPTRNFAKLSDDDLLFIDRSTLDYASLYLPEADARTVQPPLVMPASFRTLIGRKGRNHLVRVGATAGGKVLKTNLIVELVDVSLSTPGSTLTEVAALLGQLCRAVFIRLQPAKDMMAPVRIIRPQGLTLDAADLGQTDADIAAAIIAFGEQARHQAPMLAVQGLPAEGFFHVAQVAGLTHAGMRADAVTILAA